MIDIKDESINIPLRDKIEAKLGPMLVVRKSKEDRIFFYSADDDKRGLPCVLWYDELTKLFWFEGKKYNEREFEKLLDWLIFI